MLSGRLSHFSLIDARQEEAGNWCDTESVLLSRFGLGAFLRSSIPFFPSYFSSLRARYGRKVSDDIKTPGKRRPANWIVTDRTWLDVANNQLFSQQIASSRGGLKIHRFVGGTKMPKSARLGSARLGSASGDRENKARYRENRADTGRAEVSNKRGGHSFREIARNSRIGANIIFAARGCGARAVLNSRAQKCTRARAIITVRANNNFPPQFLPSSAPVRRL